MVFNDTVTQQGIVQDTYFEAQANAITYSIADIVRNSNVALSNVNNMILSVDGTWQFDSKNATDIPIGTTTITSGQSAYTFDSDLLTTSYFEVSDNDGVFHKIFPIDNYDGDMSLSEYQKQVGVPEYYDKIGESIILYPTPNYTIAPTDPTPGGLRGYFQRNIDYFTANDTSKKPGFAEHLHKYVSLYNAYVYASAKDSDRAARLEKRLEFYEGNQMRGGQQQGAIRDFYDKREKDVQRGISAEIINPY